MRVAILALASLAIFPALCPAVEPERFYYVGEVKLSSATGDSLGSQVILLEKIHDRDKSAIVERAIVVKADGKVEDHAVRMAVTGNAFQLTDDAKTIEGSGTLSGPAWKWTYFKAAYKSRNGVQIEDENFMADDSVITARKKVLRPDGEVLMYMDMSLKGITPNTFTVIAAGLMKRESVEPPHRR